MNEQVRRRIEVIREALGTNTEALQRLEELEFELIRLSNMESYNEERIAKLRQQLAK